MSDAKTRPYDDGAMLVRSPEDAGAWSARARGGMVASAHWRATAAGRAALARGGNAFDAAVATSLALGVCEFAGSGLGGMALAVLHKAASRRTFTLEGPCRAPRRATVEAVGDQRRSFGARAVAVPTLPALLMHLLETYGTLPLSELAEPAIRVAEEGFPISPLQHRLLCENQRRLVARSAGSIFLDAAGRPPREGAILRQPDLALTLRRLASEGFEDFYLGGIAAQIAHDLEEKGGFLRADDLADIPRPEEAEPLLLRVGARTLHTLPPPAGGRSLFQMLRMWEALAGRPALETPEGLVLLAGVIRRVRADRRRQGRGLAGPGFAEERLTDAYARRAALEVESSLLGEGETTHLSVMDAEGNAVAMTQSIERTFGSRELTPGLGFLYNGYLRTFKTKHPSHPHYLRPGAKARSNAVPTIGLEDGVPAFAIGSTGSERMASSIFQVLARLETEDPFAAVASPRLHATPQGVVLLEARFPAALPGALSAHGFHLRTLAPWSFRMGGLQLVVRRDGLMTGVADPRRDGAAAGT